MGENIAKHGGKFTYHNHQHEFAKMENGKTIMEMLVEELHPENTSFVLDTYWVQTGGGDVCDWIEKLAGRIDILHLKDMTLNPKDELYKLTEVGYGNLSFDPIIKAAEETGVKYYVVEQDGNWTGGPVNALRLSAEFLAKYRK